MDMAKRMSVVLLVGALLLGGSAIAQPQQEPATAAPRFGISTLRATATGPVVFSRNGYVLNIILENTSDQAAEIVAHWHVGTATLSDNGGYVAGSYNGGLDMNGIEKCENFGNSCLQLIADRRVLPTLIEPGFSIVLNVSSRNAARAADRATLTIPVFFRQVPNSPGARPEWRRQMISLVSLPVEGQ
jgi:hypothetical protein